MFKANKGTKPARKPGGGAALMQQMGFQVPNFDGSGMGVDDAEDDDDLEAELRRLQGMDDNRGAKGKKGKPGQDLQAFHNDVNRLLQDIDRPINDDELSDADEDELLAELNEITDDFQHENDAQMSKPAAKSTGNVISLLESRQDMYSKAVAGAKASGDATKCRRLERQFKTVQDLLKSARAGEPIDESEIPPEVFIASQATAPTPAARTQPPPQQVPIRAPSPPRQVPQPAVPPQPRVVRLSQPAVVSPPKQNNPVPSRPQPQPQMTVADSDPAVARLKTLALQAKQQGDMAKAKEYIVQLRTLQNKSSIPAPTQQETYDNVPDDDDAPPPPLPLKAPEPRTVMEALQQRHEELNKRGEEAASKGDASKARRMERISKQYEEAIVATRKGQPYDYGTLPELPGFAPIPVQQQQPQPVASKPTASAAQGRPAQAQPQPQQQQRTTVPVASATSSTSARKSQQAQTLRLKQEKFYKLAGNAKQQGDVETAKKFLVAYKGLEQMIAAAEAGLPVDMSQVPKLPDDENDLINDDDLVSDLAHADRDTIYRRLQDDLLRQIQLCARNQQIYAQMVGVNTTKQVNEYKTLEQRCSRDLEKLRSCFQHGLKPPLFHYERKQMTIVQSNDDLGENDLEVTVIRGINLPVPSGQSTSSMETYITVEFPYPTDEPQIVRTKHTTGSVNAEYPESTHKFYIKRNDAKFRRLMNRKDLKLVVFYKPGFLRTDRPLGSASIKLADLEEKCTIHESVDLYEVEHKKKIEGKLEVKIRIKEALGQTKASDILPQRWLVIDQFEQTTDNSKSSSGSKAPAITAIARLVPTGDAFSQIAINMAGETKETESSHHRRRSSQQAQPVSQGPQSVQILNYEASLLQQQIEQLEDRLTPDQLHQLQMKHRNIEEQSNQLVDSLRRGGKQAVQDHLRGLQELVDYYDQEAREHHQRRDSKKAEICLTKKKLALKEINTLSGSQPTSTTRF